MKFILTTLIVPFASAFTVPHHSWRALPFSNASNSDPKVSSVSALNATLALSPQDQAKKAQNINPAWSPDPTNIAPISTGIPLSPWNDNGRSQMLENLTPEWPVCPESEYFNCKKCPGDFRCLPTSMPSATDIIKAAIIPSSASIMTTLLKVPVQVSPSSAVSESSSPSPAACPLRMCNNSTTPCGTNAMCTPLGHCACPRGYTGVGTAVRGWTGRVPLDVYVDPNVACSIPCESPYCEEVATARCGESEADEPSLVKTRVARDVTKDGIGDEVAGDSPDAEVWGGPEDVDDDGDDAEDAEDNDNQEDEVEDDGDDSDDAEDAEDAEDNDNLEDEDEDDEEVPTYAGPRHTGTNMGVILDFILGVANPANTREDT